MSLQLVPIEGDITLTEEEKRWKERRSRAIPVEMLIQFTDDEVKGIKLFLAKLVALTEQCHHCISQLEIVDASQKEFIETELEGLNDSRINLFENPPFYMKRFIKLLSLCPSEPWKEFEEFLKNIRDEDMETYRETKLNTGIDAAMDNPFLLQMDDDIEDIHIELQQKCRITPYEIENLLVNHSLESLVNHLVAARRVSSGEFWDKGFYDL